jgi:hypothetical protein
MGEQRKDPDSGTPTGVTSKPSEIWPSADTNQSHKRYATQSLYTAHAATGAEMDSLGRTNWSGWMR